MKSANHTPPKPSPLIHTQDEASRGLRTLARIIARRHVIGKGFTEAADMKQGTNSAQPTELTEIEPIEYRGRYGATDENLS